MDGISTCRLHGVNPTEVKGIRTLKSGVHEVTIQHPLLPGNGRVSRNFDDREEGARYKVRMLGILHTGIVPPELTRDGVRLNQHTATAPARPVITAPVSAGRAGSPQLSEVLQQYLGSGTAKIAKSDRPVVVALTGQLRGGTLSGVTTTWADLWVRHMKRVDQLTPGTIRKKVEALARAIDWWYRREQKTETAVNPLRLMPKGYSSYGDGDVAPGQDRPTDTARDRRLHHDEPAKIEAVLLGLRREDRQLAWGKNDTDRAHFRLLFRLIVATGMRLREAYRLRPADIKYDLRTIHVAKTKTGRPRDIPMTRQLEGWLREHIAAEGIGADEPAFTFWGGSEDEQILNQTSNRLSRRFSTLFAYAGCKDLVEHDLRHEATCRWMEMKDKEGRWLFRGEEVQRITGHKSAAMFARYLSLRGSDLAERLD